jgi:hypothetical protein
MMGERNSLYNLFHLNLAFSSIPESDRSAVVERCYAPLIDLARSTGCPITLEATGWTLERIAEISPNLIEDIRDLLSTGLCEFVGSGYAQTIGPLMPEAANIANQRIGMDVYRKLLGYTPTVALANEQTLSAGLIPIYRDAGYRALILDWASIYSAHQDWETSWSNFPQLAIDPDGGDFPIIWCDAIMFQKFQRHAHGEIDAEDLEDYVQARLKNISGGYLALYASDAEVFDYRPGRYRSEAKIDDRGEWNRIRDLWVRLSKRNDLLMTTPSSFLNTKTRAEAWNRLVLQSASAPIVVKKQPKYNIIRWAVTGRDDLALNTACWQLYESIVENDGTTDDDWRQLLELWSSDFRTHIDDARWQKIVDTLATISPRLTPGPSVRHYSNTATGFDITRHERWLVINAPKNAVVLNLRRGGAIQSMSPTVDSHSWVGTIPHGFFDDIAWGADFYSGHLICEVPGQPKITDLEAVQPDIDFSSDPSSVARIRMIIPTNLGDIHKTILVHAERPRIEIEYDLQWENPILGSLRMANMTLNPKIFGGRNVAYRCRNGGPHTEEYVLGNDDFDLGAPISALITCGNGLGLTTGWLEIGDTERRVRLESPRTSAAMIGLITSKHIGPHRFIRASLSARENDDTCRKDIVLQLPNRPLIYRYAIELAGEGIPHTSK